MIVTGTFILAFGWFGFNAGSTLSGMDTHFAVVAVNTMLASACGAVAGTLWAWKRFGKPDVTMMCNGMLAGLVAITAPCAFVTVNSALIIGFLAGLIVVCAVKLLDRLKIDDPVGAVPVHLFNGVFGTLCVGLFAVDKITGTATGNGLFNGGGVTLLIAQLEGIAAVAVYTLAASLVFWYAIKAIAGLRVSREEEEEGLDIGEHGQVAYTGFANTGYGN
jgi:Amt family ammonium transporter